jgi:hypothetical protein
MRRQGPSPTDEVEMKKTLEKKCRILAKMWDPQIKGCCFVHAKSEQCCAIPLQIGTRLNSIAILLLAVGFQIFHILGFGAVERSYKQSDSLALTDQFYCGGDSVVAGFGSCLGLFVTRLLGDLTLICFCIVGIVSAPGSKIFPNMLETRHCQATVFFVGLCIGLAVHVFSLIFSFALWSSGISAACLNDTRDRIGASAPWREILCESGTTLQALLAVAQIFFILYSLYVMLITLAYRGWLIVLHMRHQKGFKIGDGYEDDVDVRADGVAKISGPSAKVAPASVVLKAEPEEAKAAPLQKEKDEEEDAFQKALDDMVTQGVSLPPQARGAQVGWEDAVMAHELARLPNIPDCYGARSSTWSGTSRTRTRPLSCNAVSIVCPYVHPLPPTRLY